MKARHIAVATALTLALTGCGNAGQTYTAYVQSVMDCTYSGVTDSYIELTGCSEEAAQALYAAEVEHVSTLLRYNATVMDESISTITAEGYDALAKELLEKVRYQVQPAIRSGEGFQISIVCEPIDFWQISLPELKRLYSSHFAERFYKAPESGEQRYALEAEWGDRALTVLEGYVEQIQYQEPQTTIVQVTVDASGHYHISDQNWQTIDQLLLGLNSAP